MAAHAAVRTEPTDAELRAAWIRIHRRDTWPATFEEAMADVLLGRLVCMNARHPPAPLRHLGGCAPNVNADPTYPRPSTPPAHLRAGWVDHKRAAAGDRDD